MNPTNGEIKNPETPEVLPIGAGVAAQLNQDWEIDNPDQLFAPIVDEPVQDATKEFEVPENAEPKLVVAEAVVDAEVPPAPVQIIEAMLFVGGSPLSAERACELIRGLTPEQFREWIDVLNRVYRMQKRPYMVSQDQQGYSLAIRQRYRGLRERLYGSPREVRLSQPALDVLALIAYRQPITRGELDSIRGAESMSILRQLTRLGLIAIVQRGETGQPDTSYGTMPRFLEAFGLRSLDDLPQLADPQQI